MAGFTAFFTFWEGVECFTLWEEEAEESETSSAFFSEGAGYVRPASKISLSLTKFELFPNWVKLRSANN